MYWKLTVVFYLKGQSSANTDLLEDVRMTLDRESLELDRMMTNMNAGSRLLKEKELKLKQLETSAMDDMVRSQDTAAPCL